MISNGWNVRDTVVWGILDTANDSYSLLMFSWREPLGSPADRRTIPCWDIIFIRMIISGAFSCPCSVFMAARSAAAECEALTSCAWTAYVPGMSLWSRANGLSVILIDIKVTRWKNGDRISILIVKILNCFRYIFCFNCCTLFRTDILLKCNLTIMWNSCY